MPFLVVGMAPLASTFRTPLHPLGLSVMVTRSFFICGNFFAIRLFCFVKKGIFNLFKKKLPNHHLSTHCSSK
jgi:hypothetical protein